MLFTFYHPWVVRSKNLNHTTVHADRGTHTQQSTHGYSLLRAGIKKTYHEETLPPTKRFPQKSKKPRCAAGAAPRKGSHTNECQTECEQEPRSNFLFVRLRRAHLSFCPSLRCSGRCGWRCVRLSVIPSGWQYYRQTADWSIGPALLIVILPTNS